MAYMVCVRFSGISPFKSVCVHSVHVMTELVGEGESGVWVVASQRGECLTSMGSLFPLTEQACSMR